MPRRRASGKDGFRLSLFGYDPARRPLSPDARNAAAAGSTWPLPKIACSSTRPLGNVPHTGGKRIDAGERSLPHAAGLARRPGAAPIPPRRRGRFGSRSFRARAVFARQGRDRSSSSSSAHYSDGTDRDVTDLAVFLSNNDAAATVTEDGLVSGDRLGQRVHPGPLRSVHRRGRRSSCARTRRTRFPAIAAAQLHRRTGLSSTGAICTCFPPSCAPTKSSCGASISI